MEKRIIMVLQEDLPFSYLVHNQFLLRLLIARKGIKRDNKAELPWKFPVPLSIRSPHTHRGYSRSNPPPAPFSTVTLRMEDKMLVANGSAVDVFSNSTNGTTGELDETVPDSPPSWLDELAERQPMLVSTE